MAPSHKNMEGIEYHKRTDHLANSAIQPHQPVGNTPSQQLQQESSGQPATPAQQPSGFLPFRPQPDDKQSTDYPANNAPTSITEDPDFVPRDLLNMRVKDLTTAELFAVGSFRYQSGDASSDDPVALAAARVQLGLSVKKVEAAADVVRKKKELEELQKAVARGLWCGRCHMFGHDGRNCPSKQGGGGKGGGGLGGKKRGGRRGENYAGVQKRYTN